MISEFFRVAHASRVLVFGVSPKQAFSTFAWQKKSSRWRDAIASTRDACATQSTEPRLNL